MKNKDSWFARALRVASLVGLGVGFVGVRSTLAQTSYVVEDLGALNGDAGSVAWAINARGDVVGWSNGTNGTRAFLYTDSTGMVALPGLPNRPRTLARDINDLGDIVGTASAGGTDPGHAVLWRSGVIEDLGTLGAGSFSEAWGINNVGHIVGSSSTNGGGGLTGVHGFLYTEAQGLTDLTPESDQGVATDINDAGQVTGYKTALGGYHAFRWQEGSFVDLGVLPGFAHSFGWAINAGGQVAGNSTSASGNSERLVRYTDGAALQNLGGVGEHNVARGINAAGHVVGTRGNSQSRALLYTDAAGLQELNALIDPSLGWVLLAANDINDAGQIVGYAFNNFTERTHAVRLLPATTPPPVCTFHCLRSTRIVLRATKSPGSYFLKGSVTVNDENEAPMAQAMVVGTWTRPDGTEENQYVWTDPRGVAVFTLKGGPGYYTLTVVNIVLSQYTFDPVHSVLSKLIAVAPRERLPFSGVTRER
jgi:probable HAF family extracellular repeat protein